MSSRLQTRFIVLALVLAAAAFVLSLWPLITRVAVASPSQSPNKQDLPVSVVEATGAMPTTFAYQGVLRLSNGTLATGNYNMTFRIYASPVGGTALFTDTIAGVAALDGIFNVVLGNAPGNGIGPAVFATAPRYLGIAVAPDAEMQPRQRINPVPWAIMASTLQAGAVVPGGLNVGTAGNGVVSISAGPGTNTALELREDAAGGTPYIDLSNDPATSDYDVRLALVNDDGLALDGGNLFVTGGNSTVQQGAARLSNEGLVVAHDSANLTTVPTGVGVATNRPNPAIAIRNDSGPALVVENGRVGIGATNPQAALDVAGEIRGKLWTSASYVWAKGQAPVRMMPVDKGFCFLTQVQGQFDYYQTNVQIVEAMYEGTNYWYLQGDAPGLGDGSVSAIARCAGIP